jgi:hypothetical protein
MDDVGHYVIEWGDLCDVIGIFNDNNDEISFRKWFTGFIWFNMDGMMIGYQ